MTFVFGNNREPGLAIDRAIWNGQRFETLPEQLTADSVADSPLPSQILSDSPRARGPRISYMVEDS